MTVNLKSNISEHLISNSFTAIKLLAELNRINLKMKNKYNFIIVPISIYNIIEPCRLFQSKPEILNSNTGLRDIGFFGNFECYLDIYLPSDEILLLWNKSIERDMKINNLLKGEEIEKEKRIKLLY
jgi:hypothetical protein